jgi:translation initiation factor 1 (eIF-1/SUI1)
MSNNPFDNDIVSNNIINNNKSIEIWIEQYGKKRNTFISGWECSIDELKNHLKILKRNHGCNGTIKNIENNIQVVMLQGDHINNIISYMNNQGINTNDINIKGYNIVN